MLRNKGAGVAVLLTSYELLMGPADAPRLSTIGWHCLIVDEGHRLKSTGCKLNAVLRQYATQHRLLLTGGAPQLCKHHPLFECFIARVFLGAAMSRTGYCENPDQCVFHERLRDVAT